MTKQADFLTMLQQPANEINGMVTGISPTQRLQMAMHSARDDDPTHVPPPTDFSNSRVGVPNPFGRGLAAFEPNNIIFDAYAHAKGEVDAEKAAEDAAKATTLNLKFGDDSGAPLGPANGQVAGAVQAALNLAQRAVPYVWGGTTANGVDCSGLIYYAFRSAGIDIPRYRAVDYGRMGQAVTVDEARPGDIVYYDEAGDTDHVGIYLGNGLMVQAPQSGDHVRVSSIGKPTSIRRIFTDDSFGQVALPGGFTGVAYNGRAFAPAANAPITPQTLPQAPGSTIYRAPVGRGAQAI